jgi:hypothetical protein
MTGSSTQFSNAPNKFKHLNTFPECSDSSAHNESCSIQTARLNIKFLTVLRNDDCNPWVEHGVRESQPFTSSLTIEKGKSFQCFFYLNTSLRRQNTAYSRKESPRRNQDSEYILNSLDPETKKSSRIKLEASASSGRADRCFWAFPGRFLGVLILVPGGYLKYFVPGFSFLVFGSWALLVRAFLVLGIAGPGHC